MNETYNVFNTLSDSAAIIESQGTILFVNNSWKTFSFENGGNNDSTDIGVNYLKVCNNVKGDDTQFSTSANKGISKVINNELNAYELEYPCHSLTEKRWFIMRVTKLATNSDLILILHINITSRKLAELKVEKSNEKINVLNTKLNSILYKVVHDIQSPLNSIIGLVNLSKEEEDIENVNEYLSLISQSSVNLKLFISETLREITSNATNDYLDFELILKKHLEAVSFQINSKSIDVSFEINQKNKLYANVQEVKSIFTNLFNNALKYSDVKKTNKYIKIYFKSEDNNAILKIEDNGIGIKEEHLANLFDSNFQINKDTSEGVGLGLFMVKKSIDHMGGKISVKSEFGKGTEFTVEFKNQ